MAGLDSSTLQTFNVHFKPARFFVMNGRLRIECLACRKRIPFDVGYLESPTTGSLALANYIGELVKTHIESCEKRPEVIISNIPKPQKQEPKTYSRRFDLE